MRTSLEVADIFNAAGPAYRAAHAGHLSLHQLKVMSAIEHFRTATMGGHVEACTDCGYWRIAISKSRLIRFDEGGVTFRYKDYRRTGVDRQQVITLIADEFIRRFLLHCLPRGFHRIRHYGLLASSTRKARLKRARQLLAVAPPAPEEPPADQPDPRPPCPCCGGRMVVIETFQLYHLPRGPPCPIAPSGIPAS